MKDINNNKLDLSDRTSIEVGIIKQEDFKTIAARIGKHPSSITSEKKQPFIHARELPFAKIEIFKQKWT